MKDNPDFLKYTALPAMLSEEEFRTEFYQKYISSPPGSCAWAIFDKVSASGKENTDRNYAGFIALTSTSRADAVTEIGIFIFPAFHRTHIASNAIGLVLVWTLDPPSADGLGLRRVEWQCHSENEASRRAATRMGFEFEGIKRWHCVLSLEKVGLTAEALGKRNGTKNEPLGRHTALFSIVWEEWEDKRPKVIALMERKQ